MNCSRLAMHLFHIVIVIIYSFDSVKRVCTLINWQAGGRAGTCIKCARNKQFLYKTSPLCSLCVPFAVDNKEDVCLIGWEQLGNPVILLANAKNHSKHNKLRDESCSFGRAFFHSAFALCLYGDNATSHKIWHGRHNHWGLIMKITASDF